MSAEVSQLSDLLAQTKVVQLNEITFSGQGLKLDSAEDAKEIVDMIISAKDVEALRLEGNTVGVSAAEAIAGALKTRKEFQKAFWSDMFTGRLRSEIPKSLESLSEAVIESGACLFVLDLSDNAFGPDGVKGIQKLLKSRACFSLEVLKLNNNGLGIGGGKLLSRAFLECHKKSLEEGHKFALKVFISGRNRLENEGAKALAEAFKVLGSLEEIQMPQNGILHPGITALGEALAYNTNLRILNLNDNTCTEKGASAIAKILPKLDNLETLNLGDCLLRNAGAKALAEGLKASTPLLKELIVSFNEIRVEGALAICDSLANKEYLSLFNIDGNQLGDGTEEVEARMQEYGKGETLASFDDNEEPDSDEGEDQEEEEEEEGEEEEEEEEDDSVDQEQRVENKTNLINGMQENDDKDFEALADKFYESPTKDVFSQLPVEKSTLILRNAAKKRSSTLEEYANLLLRTAAVMKNESKVIEAVTDAIFPDLLHVASSSADVAGALLVGIGLIKSEDKAFKVYDAFGPLKALVHAAQQKYWPKDLSEYFIAFLSKPSKILDQYSTERHHLLQKLYQ